MRFSIIFLTILIVKSLYMDPIYNNCKKGTFPPSSSILYQGSKFQQFTISPFSKLQISIDLRHLLAIPTSDLFSLNIRIIDVNNQINEIFAPITTLQPNVNVFNFQISIIVWINDSQIALKYLLMNSVCLNLQLQNTRIPSDTSSFLFITNSDNNINLPSNKPNLNHQGYFLSKMSKNGLPSVIVSDQTKITGDAYWNGYSLFATPYIPYFTNCDLSGSNLYLSNLIQGKQCNLVSLNDTVPIKQFRFGSSAIADVCLIKRTCYFDQIATTGKNQFPYWQTLGSGISPFSVTANKISYETYDITSNTFKSIKLVNCKIINSKGTNTSDKYPLNVKLRLQYYQVDSSTKRLIDCSIYYSLYVDFHTNFSYQLEIQMKPLNHTYIMLAFGFNWYVYMIIFLIIGLISNFQNFVLWLYHFLVSRKKSSSLNIKAYLKVYKQIVTGTLTALILLIAGVATICIVMNGKIFNYRIYQSNLSTTTPRVFWDSLFPTFSENYDNPATEALRSGRMGFSFIFVGVFLIINYGNYFIGCEKKKDYYKEYQIMGRKFQPLQSIKGKFIFGTFFYVFLQLIFIYFAYSKLYSTQIWLFFVTVKILQIVMEEITINVFQDILPCLPLKIVTDITAYINTLSTDNLYDFLFSFLIDVGINMSEKAYIFQIQTIIVQKIQDKIADLTKFYENIINDTEQQLEDNVKQEETFDDENQEIVINRQPDEVNFFEDEEVQRHRDDNHINCQEFLVKHQSEISFQSFVKLGTQASIMTYAQLLIPDQQETILKEKLKSYMEAKNRNINQVQNQHIPKQNLKEDQSKNLSQVFQLLIDAFADIFTFILQPVVVLILWMTYEESSILNNYGIQSSTIILYVLSAIVIGLFTSINVILIFLILQSYLCVDFQTSIFKLLERFDNRQIFWKANDDDVNTQIQENMRGADHYCLSSQFFFLLTIYVTAMIYIILGICIMINVTYNPFKDKASIFIMCFWSILLIILVWILKYFAKFINLWGYRDFTKQKHRQNSDQSHQPKHYKSIVIQNNDISQNLTNNIPQTTITSIKFLRKETIHNFIQQQEEVKSCKIKLQTICKKLQPLFSQQKFKMQFSLKNKKFIKSNIDKILPLVKNLQQFNDYKMPQDKTKNQEAKKLANQNNHIEPIVTEIMNKWLKATQKNRQDRQNVGLDLERQLKRCNYCYETWSIYYGYGGICFNCSKKLSIKKNQ